MSDLINAVILIAGVFVLVRGIQILMYEKIKDSAEEP
jgi:hypothetical protein